MHVAGCCRASGLCTREQRLHVLVFCSRQQTTSLGTRKSAALLLTRGGGVLLALILVPEDSRICQVWERGTAIRRALTFTP